MVAGNHGLFFGVFSGSQGNHGEIRGSLSIWRGGNSQLTLDSMGPLPLSILGSEAAGTASSLAQRSILTGGLILLGVSLDKGTSSLFFIGVFSGYFIGEICFFFFLVSPALFFIGAAGGPVFLIPDGPGFGALISCRSS